MGLGVLNVVVFLDGSIGWVLLFIVTVGIEFGRYIAFILGRGRG